MANIAQTVNVLQSLLHTDGGKMILNPTYHVFENKTLWPDLLPASRNRIFDNTFYTKYNEKATINFNPCTGSCNDYHGLVRKQ